MSMVENNIYNSKEKYETFVKWLDSLLNLKKRRIKKLG